MLALVGSGEYLLGMQPVDLELIRRLGDAPRVVCLPTAAGQEGEQRVDYWMRLGIEHFTSLGAEVTALPVIDHDSASDPEMAAKIGEANFVYLSGGNPNYLYQSLLNTPAWDAIQTVLAGGGLLAGCSAGAMIMGEKLFGFPGWKPAFNLLPGAIIMPHFDEIPAAMVALLGWFTTRRMTLLGIEGYTALFTDGDYYEVLGSGGVTVWSRSGKTRYTSGRLSIAGIKPSPASSAGEKHGS